MGKMGVAWIVGIIRTFLCCPWVAIEYDMSYKQLSAQDRKVAKHSMDDIL